MFVIASLVIAAVLIAIVAIPQWLSKEARWEVLRLHVGQIGQLAATNSDLSYEYTIVYRDHVPYFISIPRLMATSVPSTICARRVICSHSSFATRMAGGSDCGWQNLYPAQSLLVTG